MKSLSHNLSSLFGNGCGIWIKEHKAYVVGAGIALGGTALVGAGVWITTGWWLIAAGVIIILARDLLPRVRDKVEDLLRQALRIIMK